MPRYADDQLQRVMNAAARMLCGACIWCNPCMSSLVASSSMHSFPAMSDDLQSDAQIGACIVAYWSELCEHCSADVICS